MFPAIIYRIGVESIRALIHHRGTEDAQSIKPLCDLCVSSVTLW
jgi:hypothetical protein